MSEANKALIRRMALEVVERGDLSRVAEFFAPHYTPHDSSDPDREPGLEATRAVIARLHAGLSQVRYALDELLAEGDKVVCRWTLTGVHTGTFMGVPASGRPLVLSGIDILRIEGGKIAESWLVSDMLSLLLQLGVIPPPRQA
jgi:steroid delta-isomerase-like uncharacterized protein